MSKICRNCNVQFEIPSEDLKIYEHFVVPQPTFCPLCRMQRRMTFRNERNLYKSKCDFSDKEMLSLYPTDSKFKVYDQKIWWSDVWDAMTYGRDFDFNKPFFEQFEALMSDVPRINLQNRQNENSDYCNGTNDLKNCYLCFNSEQAANFYYCNSAGIGSDCVDCFWSLQVELCYECTKCMGAYHSFWCFNCSGISDCYFCRDLMGCKNCFGCIGLRQKEYCVFNKQYLQEEYGKLVAKIIEHMKNNGDYGEFFPIKLSPFGYNDTLANWYFPLSREDALKKGYKWNDFISPKIGMKTFSAKDLPQKIEIIACENDQKLFKIIPQELAFYRKHKLPLPHFCPDCRHEKRKRQMNPRKLWERKCAKCQVEIKTTYVPEAPEVVYCHDCYLAEIY
ncbi:hypothetical protein HZA40_05280 [Candidatus Peregrinibacteria bacterium]|nr:hypothetical protein [Candidatus Peregrinibacteria bacterium]